MNLSELVQLTRDAKPGPWTVEDFGNPREYEVGFGDPDRFGYRPRVVRCGEPAEAQGLDLADARLIVAARNCLSALLTVADAAARLYDENGDHQEKRQSRTCAQCGRVWPCAVSVISDAIERLQDAIEAQP